MITVHADGLCSPNDGTGTGTWAFIVLDGDKTLHVGSGAVPAPTTNNVMEYTAVFKAIEYLQQNMEFVVAHDFDIFTDSQLVVKQLSGEWACNNETLKLIRDKIFYKLNSLDTVGVKWIPGKDNRADAITREAFRTATGRDPIDYSTWKKKK